MDLLLLEARAFSASAWGADGKVGRDYRVRVERLSHRGGGGGGGAAVLDSCRAKSPEPYKNNSRPCFGTTKHHSEIKDVQEQLTEYTIHSFVSHKRQAGQTNLRLFLNCKKSKLIPCKNGSIFPKARGRRGSGRTSGQSSPCMQVRGQRWLDKYTHPWATLSLKQTQG